MVNKRISSQTCDNIRFKVVARRILSELVLHTANRWITNNVGQFTKRLIFKGVDLAGLNEDTEIILINHADKSAIGVICGHLDLALDRYDVLSDQRQVTCLRDCEFLSGLVMSGPCWQICYCDLFWVIANRTLDKVIQTISQSLITNEIIDWARNDLPLVCRDYARLNVDGKVIIDGELLIARLLPVSRDCDCTFDVNYVLSN